MRKIIILVAATALLATMFILPAYARSGYRQVPNTNYSQNVNPAPVDIDALVAAQKAYLDTLVEKGVITQEEADSQLANYKLMLENRNTNGGAGYGGYGYGGYGCCGGWRW